MRHNLSEVVKGNGAEIAVREQTAGQPVGGLRRLPPRARQRLESSGKVPASHQPLAPERRRRLQRAGSQCLPAPTREHE